MAISPESLGASIKRARERRGWIQQQLADAVGVDRKTVDNWENGRTSPRNKLGKIEEVLELRLEDGHLVDARGDVRPTEREAVSTGGPPGKSVVSPSPEDAGYVSHGDDLRSKTIDELQAEADARLLEIARRAREANPDAR